jgi:hypothetical protein
MIVSVRKWLMRAKFAMLFVVLTAVAFSLFRLISAWIEPAQRYKEPTGKAVKVFEQRQSRYDEAGSALERLKLFYWYGE